MAFVNVNLETCIQSVDGLYLSILFALLVPQASDNLSPSLSLSWCVLFSLLYLVEDLQCIDTP